MIGGLSLSCTIDNCNYTTLHLLFLTGLLPETAPVSVLSVRPAPLDQVPVCLSRSARCLVPCTLAPPTCNTHCSDALAIVFASASSAGDDLDSELTLSLSSPFTQRCHLALTASHLCVRTPGGGVVVVATHVAPGIKLS